MGNIRRKRLPYHLNHLRMEAINESRKIQLLLGADMAELMDDLEDAVAEGNIRLIDMIVLTIRHRWDGAKDKAKIIQMSLEQMTVEDGEELENENE